MEEFVGHTKHFRKHAIRMPVCEPCKYPSTLPRVRLYVESMCQALIVLLEAGDRICSKRLTGAESGADPDIGPPRPIANALEPFGPPRIMPMRSIERESDRFFPPPACLATSSQAYRGDLLRRDVASAKRGQLQIRFRALRGVHVITVRFLRLAAQNAIKWRRDACNACASIPSSSTR